VVEPLADQSAQLGVGVSERALGQALIAAADEIEQMNDYDQIGVIRSPGTALPPVPLPPG
jgi:hypothetical protein